MWGDPGYKETTLGNIKLHLRKYGPHEIHGSGFVDFFWKAMQKHLKKSLRGRCTKKKVKKKLTSVICMYV